MGPQLYENIHSFTIMAFPFKFLYITNQLWNNSFQHLLYQIFWESNPDYLITSSSGSILFHSLYRNRIITIWPIFITHVCFFKISHVFAVCMSMRLQYNLSLSLARIKGKGLRIRESNSQHKRHKKKGAKLFHHFHNQIRSLSTRNII